MTNSRLRTILIYVFLSIFALTAAVTLAGVAKALPVDRDDLNWLMPTLIGEVIGAVIILFKQLVIPPPSQSPIKFVSKDTPRIWDNFVKTYRAYNAPWKVEFYSGALDKFVAIHKKRYSNEKLTSVNYLYFSDEDFETNCQSESWQCFERFVKFEAMVFL